MAAPRRRIWRTPTPAAGTTTPEDGDIAVLRDLTHALLRAERADEAFQYALDRVCPAAGATLGSVFVLDGASELMHLVAAHAWPERWRPWLGEMRVRVGFGPSGEAVSERRPIEVPDVLADPGLEDWREVAGELGFRALVALPLVTNAGVTGAAAFYFAAPGSPAPRVRHLLRAAADVMAAIAEKSALQDRLRRAEAALDSLNAVNPPPVPGVEAPEEPT
ncbi:MAG: GAF domain-containing protein [Gemmatimonadaceae bacterium]|nr:GAF domain-containing protein [Gemmatimonadaceae bacterium]